MDVVAVFLTGVLAGAGLKVLRRAMPWVDRATTGAVFLLLFLLGHSLGSNPTVVANIGHLGFQALLITAGSLAGSVLPAWWMSRRWFGHVSHPDPSPQASGLTIPVPDPSPQVPGPTAECDIEHEPDRPEAVVVRRSSVPPAVAVFGRPLSLVHSNLPILLFFAAGIVHGLTNWPRDMIRSEALTLYALYLLLFLVGIGAGSNRGAWATLRRAKARVLLVPGAIVAGTLAGAAVVGLLLPGLAVPEALAVGAGMGYYSLSSVLIARVAGESLGAVALLSNISREVATLLLAPLLAQWFGRLAPIAAGGATAMDTTLPVISRASGPDFAVIAVFSGFVQTAAVPFLVTLFLW